MVHVYGCTYEKVLEFSFIPKYQVKTELEKKKKEVCKRHFNTKPKLYDVPGYLLVRNLLVFSKEESFLYAGSASFGNLGSAELS